jgi:biotin transport system substrate-specific component
MSKTKQLVFCSLFTALIVVGAFIKIPVPVVPFTLQYLFTMLAGLILGPRLGTISVTAYMLLGLAGLPIFTEGGGLWYVLKPSFGYIIGFCIGTYVTGTLAAKLKKRTFARYLAANLAGLAVVYAAGMIYYYVICNYVLNTPIAVGPLFLYCFVLAVPGDTALSVLGAVLIKRLAPLLERSGIWTVSGTPNIPQAATAARS